MVTWFLIGSPIPAVMCLAQKTITILNGYYDSKLNAFEAIFSVIVLLGILARDVQLLHLIVHLCKYQNFL